MCGCVGVWVCGCVGACVCVRERERKEAGGSETRMSIINWYIRHKIISSHHLHWTT